MQLNTLSMVHEFLRRTVKPGDFCIDATAGKGRDTALLCRLTGDAGRVLAFDIQEAAVAQTKALLAAEGLTAEVIRDSHANMERYAVAETVDCVVFNFGRLPRRGPVYLYPVGYLRSGVGGGSAAAEARRRHRHCPVLRRRQRLRGAGCRDDMAGNAG